MGNKNDIKNARQIKEATQDKNKKEENRESIYREAERTIHIIDILKRYSDEAIDIKIKNSKESAGVMETGMKIMNRFINSFKVGEGITE